MRIAFDAHTRPPTAYLSCGGEYTVFESGPDSIRFRTSRHLRGYKAIKAWDRGYLVVVADYDTLGEVEEYIDLVPILRDLYFDPDEFLTPIREVVVRGD